MKNLCFVLILLALCGAACSSSAKPDAQRTPTTVHTVAPTKQPGENATIAARATASSEIPPTPLLERENVMTKVEETTALFLRWDDETGRFIYAQFNPPHSRDLNAVSWWAFDPVQGRKEPCEEPSAYQPDDEIKQSLDIYDSYASLSSSGEHIVYVRAQKADEPGAPLPVYEFVELWYADRAGKHPVKLGDLPLPWKQVVWLDDEQSALVTVGYESFDAGISAFAIAVDGNSFINLFEELTEVFEALRGIPMAISVSPSSRWIAFTTFAWEASLEDDLWILDRATESIQRIDSVDARVWPVWSEDNLYYIQNDSTYLPGMSPDTDPVIARFDVNTGQIHQLTSPGEIGRPLISAWAVSENGRHVLFNADSVLGFLDGGLWLVTLENAPTLPAASDQTLAPTPTPEVVGQIMAESEPRTHATYPSPDGAWQTEVVIYDCVQVGELDVNAYEQLKLVQVDDGIERVVDTQLQSCGGLGAYGLEGLFWSPAGRYFYYTDARQGVPDGCGYWERPILRLDTADGSTERLGNGLLSPDGTEIAAWQGEELTVWQVDGDQIARIEVAVPGVPVGSSVWSPDSQTLAYLQSAAPCYPADSSYLVHFDPSTGQQSILSRSETPVFVGLAWGSPDQITLSDQNGVEWVYDLPAHELRPIAAE